MKMIINDKWGQRILATTLGISALMMGSALLVASVKWTGHVHAEDWQPTEVAAPWDDSLRGAVGLGIKDNTGYFIIWSQPNQLYKVDLSKARNWYED